MAASRDPANHIGRFKSLDGAVGLARVGHHIKLPLDIDEFVRSIPPGERGVWLRKVISEAVRKELEGDT